MNHSSESLRRSRTPYILGAFAALLGLATLYFLRDPTPRFLERRSRLVAWREGPAEPLDGHLVQTVHLTAASGLEVDLTMKRPATEGGRRPLVVILGGHRTGKEAARLIPDTHGTIVVALSYPFKGDPRLKGLQVVRKVPAIRNALLDTPPAVMLALDYLLARPDVDPARVETIGVSLGAPFVVVAGALDRRVSRVWAIHGSGGSYTPLEHNMRRKIPFPASVLVAGLSNVLIAGPRLAPERWAAQIAPREFVMINALDDERLPRAAVEKLYASARQPKSITWMPGRHVRSRPEVIRQLVDMVLARVMAPTRDGRGAAPAPTRPAGGGPRYRRPESGAAPATAGASA